jgi:hypothetical protein
MEDELVEDAVEETETPEPIVCSGGFEIPSIAGVF